MYPATVVQVISNFYFLVEIDDFSKGENDTGTRLCCHSDSPDIFPARWALWKGVNLVTPKGEWFKTQLGMYCSNIHNNYTVGT